jgi:hypothetical protein
MATEHDTTQEQPRRLLGLPMTFAGRPPRDSGRGPGTPTTPGSSPPGALPVVGQGSSPVPGSVSVLGGSAMRWQVPG